MSELSRRSRTACRCALLLLICALSARAQTLWSVGQTRGGSGVAHIAAHAHWQRDSLAFVDESGASYAAIAYSNQQVLTPQLVKISESGQVLWQAKLPGTTNPGGSMGAINSIQPLGADKLVALVTASNVRRLVIAINGSTGAVLWQQEIGGGGIGSLAVSDAGDIVAAGGTDVAFSNKCTLYRFDATTGNLIWTQDLVVPDWNCAGVGSLAVRGDSVTWAVRYRESLGGTRVGLARLQDGLGRWSVDLEPGRQFDLGSALVLDHNFDVHVVLRALNEPASKLFKLSGSSGAALWQRPILGQGGQADSPRHLAVDVAGSAYVLGSNRAGSLVELTLDKYSGSSGGVLWQQRRSFAFDSPYEFGRVTFGPASEVYVGASITTVDQGRSDLFVARYSAATGQQQWSASWGGGVNFHEALYAMRWLPSGQVVLIGHTEQSAEVAHGKLARLAFDESSGAMQSLRVIGVAQEGLDDRLACGNHDLRPMRTDANGAQILVGCRWDGTKNQVLLAKWDARGSPVWDVGLPFPWVYNLSQVKGLVLNEQGNAFLFVHGWASAIIGVNGSTGVPGWTWRPPDADGVHLFDVVSDPQAGLIVFGSRRTQPGAATTLFIGRVSPQWGTLVSSRNLEQLPLPSSMQFVAMRGDGQGHVFVVIDDSSGWPSGGRLLKIRAVDGEIVWMLTHPIISSSYADPYMLTSLPDGGVLVSNKFPTGHAHCRITRYSAAGEQLWQQSTAPDGASSCMRPWLYVQGPTEFRAVTGGAQSGGTTVCNVEARSLAAGQLLHAVTLGTTPGISLSCDVQSLPGGSLFATGAQEDAHPLGALLTVSRFDPQTGQLLSHMSTGQRLARLGSWLQSARDDRRLHLAFSSETDAGLRAKLVSLDLDGIFGDGFGVTEN